MSACGIYGDFYLYLEFYLPNRKQFTVLNGVKSNLAGVEFGVPQFLRKVLTIFRAMLREILSYNPPRQTLQSIMWICRVLRRFPKYYILCKVLHRCAKYYVDLQDA